MITVISSDLIYWVLCLKVKHSKAATGLKKERDSHKRYMDF